MTGSPPNRDDINHMASLISIMNAGMSDEDDSVVMETYKESIPSVSKSLSEMSSDKDAMKQILSRMYAANDTVIEKSKTNTILREAIDTQQIKDGVQIGHFIIAKEDGLWNVIDQNTKKKIAEDLALYDAAYGIAKFLYEGAMINDHRIKTILIQESDYAKYVNDAAMYKARMKTADSRKKMIFEDRYSVAYERASSSKKIIKDLLKE